MSLAKPTLTESKSPSRRALLAGALGGLGALAASAVARVSPARAADGQNVVLGIENASNTETGITNADGNELAFYGHVGGAGIGLLGESSSGPGVRGTSSTGDGVQGTSGSGVGARTVSDSGTGLWAQSTSGDAVRATTGAGMAVYGSNNASVPAVFGWSVGTNAGVAGRSGTGEGEPENAERTGVYGEAQLDPLGRGVWGSAIWGRGVVGETQTGVGLFGTATSGFALRTSGRLKADKVSGVATISAGSTTKTVTPGVNVTAGSFVLLTPKANIGSRALWFTTNATANTFTIRMSSARSSGTKVAWLLLG